jgi:2-iminobutanoate/2-iminopropanoate deaminase
MEKRVVVSERGPEAKGPYSAAVALGSLLFVSGQGPVDPGSGRIVGETVEEQIERAFENVRLILEDAGSSLGHVLKVTLYLSDMDNFGRANEVYKGFFEEGAYPARTTIQAGRLPFDILVEVDVIAYVP